MKEIHLTREAIALVDDEDFTRLDSHKWHLHICITSAGVEKRYARRSIYNPETQKNIGIYMHREILPAPEVDHRDGNGLNNQKHNLRSATRVQNSGNANLRRGKKTSRFKGVSWFSSRHQWRAYGTINYRFKHLGYFEREADAALAYDRFANEYFGEFALLNFPSEGEEG